MYGWTIVIILDLVSLWLYLNPKENAPPMTFWNMITFWMILDSVILCSCTAVCWLFSTWRHWRQERRLNSEARRIVELTQKILTYPKNIEEEYLAKLFQDFRKG
jgi:hypothetical protein